MVTTKPISTISYNSESFLVNVLNSLLEAHKIQFWSFIRHKAEEDEKKPHFHVYVEPTKRLDTEALKDEFKEIDLNSKEPLKCLAFRNSKLSDWIWYGIHDKAYLASKGQSRKYHYELTEIKVSDDDEWCERLQENPRPRTQFNKAKELISRGYSNVEIIESINAPIQYTHAYFNALELLRNDMTYRKERTNHESHGNEDVAELMPFEK